MHILKNVLAVASFSLQKNYTNSDRELYFLIIPHEDCQIQTHVKIKTLE